MSIGSESSFGGNRYQEEENGEDDLEKTGWRVDFLHLFKGTVLHRRLREIRNSKNRVEMCRGLPSIAETEKNPRFRELFQSAGPPKSLDFLEIDPDVYPTVEIVRESPKEYRSFLASISGFDEELMEWKKRKTAIEARIKRGELDREGQEGFSKPEPDETAILTQSLDALGSYDPEKRTIKLFETRILNFARQAGAVLDEMSGSERFVREKDFSQKFSEEFITYAIIFIVELHELGHAYVHLGRGKRFNPLTENQLRERLVSFKDLDKFVSEQLAQYFVLEKLVEMNLNKDTQNLPTYVKQFYYFLYNVFCVSQNGIRSVLKSSGLQTQGDAYLVDDLTARMRGYEINRAFCAIIDGRKVPTKEEFTHDIYQSGRNSILRRPISINFGE